MTSAMSRATLGRVPARRVVFVRLLIFALIVLGLYSLLRFKRAELVDFVVPLKAAGRFLAHEPLYRPEDGHYQYKYFPAFALAMAPFTFLPKEIAEFTWFTLTVAMTWALLSLSLFGLPDRRLSPRTLFWVTLLLNGKFLVKELAFGQFNLIVALLMLGAAIVAQQGAVVAAGVLVGAAVFVKPYALVLVPWLAWRLGVRSLVSFGVVLALGLLLPVAFYGWQGNLTLLQEWYRTVTSTTAPNLLMPDNMSFASMWAKWLGPGPAASSLALASIVVSVAAGIFMMARWRVAEPYYLEVAYFLVLIPLLSPQGWDYVLVIALPVYMCLVDRWPDLSPPWRLIMLVGVLCTSFSVFDIVGRTLYTQMTQWGAVGVGAVLIALCAFHVRSRKLA
jgi:hypothetical protein